MREAHQLARHPLLAMPRDRLPDDGVGDRRRQRAARLRAFPLMPPPGVVTGHPQLGSVTLDARPSHVRAPLPAAMRALMRRPDVVAVVIVAFRDPGVEVAPFVAAHVARAFRGLAARVMPRLSFCAHEDHLLKGSDAILMPASLDWR